MLSTMAKSILKRSSAKRIAVLRELISEFWPKESKHRQKQSVRWLMRKGNLNTEPWLKKMVQERERRAKRVKMTEQQRIEYKLYRQGCQINNFEPVRADFLAGDIPSCVIDYMGSEQNENEWQRRKAMAATAGR
jgi:hypothetical protein